MSERASLLQSAYPVHSVGIGLYLLCKTLYHLQMLRCLGGCCLGLIRSGYSLVTGLLRTFGGIINASIAS